MATYNLELGPCEVYFDSIDLGPSEGGVKFTTKLDTADLHADQFGTSAYDSVITGLEGDIEVPIADLNVVNFAKVTPGATLYTQATPEGYYLEVKASIGTNLRSYAKELILKRIVAGVPSTDKRDWYTFPIAAQVTNADLTFDAKTQRTLKTTFKAFLDPDTKRLYYRGDSSVSH
jgi:hypothetical protein